MGQNAGCDEELRLTGSSHAIAMQLIAIQHKIQASKYRCLITLYNSRRSPVSSLLKSPSPSSSSSGSGSIPELLRRPIAVLESRLTRGSLSDSARPVETFAGQRSDIYETTRTHRFYRRFPVKALQQLTHSRCCLKELVLPQQPFCLISRVWLYETQ